jgi:hypothetical protein
MEMLMVTQAEPGSKSRWLGVYSIQALFIFEAISQHMIDAQSLQSTWERRTDTQTTHPIHSFKTGKQIITINSERKSKLLYSWFIV